jgi:hypothetical protein
MVALPDGRFENVLRSLYDYIQVHYMETPFYLGDQPTFDTTNISEWVEFRLEPASRRFIRHVSSAQLGNIIFNYFNVEIQVRPTDDIMRIYRIRDIVTDTFQKASINIYDYAGGHSGNVVGKLVSQGVLADVPLGFQNDFSRWAMTFDFRHIEVYVE